VLAHCFAAIALVASPGPGQALIVLGLRLALVEQR
jgi:hypothetical protein